MSKKVSIKLKGNDIVPSRGLVIGPSYESGMNVSKWHTTQTPMSINFSVSAVVVGGGGSGGSYYGLGGGAGGGIFQFSFTINAGTAYPVVVGAGGVYDSVNNIPTSGGSSSFAGVVTRGGGYGASGGDYNSPLYFPEIGGGGGGAPSVNSNSDISNGATGDAFGKAGGNGLWDDNDPAEFDALGGGGGGYLTAGANANPWITYGTLPPQNGGNGVLVSYFFPDLVGNSQDWGIGFGGGGGCAWGASYYSYTSGGFLGGNAYNSTLGAIGYYGGRGGGQYLGGSVAAKNGIGYFTQPSGGAGNGGGGGAFNGSNPGNGSDGAVILKIPQSLPWDQTTTEDNNPYVNVSDPINGFIYLNFPQSGTFYML